MQGKRHSGGSYHSAGSISRVAASPKICHPRLLREFLEETAVFPDDDEFNHLNKLDHHWHLTKWEHKVGAEFTLSANGNMNRYFILVLYCETC